MTKISVNPTLLVMSFLTGILMTFYLAARTMDNSVNVCDAPELQLDFNSTLYMGRWYEMMREKNIWF